MYPIVISQVRDRFANQLLQSTGWVDWCVNLSFHQLVHHWLWGKSFIVYIVSHNWLILLHHDINQMLIWWKIKKKSWNELSTRSIWCEIFVLKPQVSAPHRGLYTVGSEASVRTLLRWPLAHSAHAMCYVFVACCGPSAIRLHCWHMDLPTVCNPTALVPCDWSKGQVTLPTMSTLCLNLNKFYQCNQDINMHLLLRT